MQIKEILNLNNAKLLSGDINATLDNFTIDTRTIKKGDTFIGIKGENFDGNTFYQEAIQKGAKNIIISGIEIDPDFIKNYPVNIIKVSNTYDFIIAYSKLIRSKLNIPVIAVTGSVGKTSTRNIIASVLSKKYKVFKTSGNYNTVIGLFLTLNMLKDAEILVLEMGMNKFGEIALLSEIAKPDVAVITNIGTAHIGNLGSRENILKAKLEILDGLSGPIIINNDNDLLHAWAKDAQITNKIITFGIDNKSDYTATDIKYSKEGSSFKINNNPIDINVIGKHFIYNSLVAFSIGSIYEVPSHDIITSLANIPLEKNRMEIINKDNYTIINDSYNASFDSVYYALQVLNEFTGTKIAILGDILELGEYETKIYEQIADVITNINIDLLLTVGPNSFIINNAAQKLGYKNTNLHFNSNKEAINYINNIEKENSTILVKASHSLNFKEIVDNI